MSKVVNFQRQKPDRVGGIPAILAAMGVAGTAGYFGPGLVEKLHPPGGPQFVSLSTVETIVGRASVIDGDTIEIHGERVRFNGIDAPESAQLCADASSLPYRCGARSAEVLSKWLAAASPTTCKFVERDQYGRFVGNCNRADGAGVQIWLVRNGHAMDWPRYSNGAFAKEQSAAKSEKIGIWQGKFQPPWEWRAAQREQSDNSSIVSVVPSAALPAAASGQSGACSIKGNISRKGDRIYHVPGQKLLCSDPNIGGQRRTLVLFGAGSTRCGLAPVTTVGRSQAPAMLAVALVRVRSTFRVKAALVDKVAPITILGVKENNHGWQGAIQYANPSHEGAERGVQGCRHDVHCEGRSVKDAVEAQVAGRRQGGDRIVAA